MVVIFGGSVSKGFGSFYRRNVRNEVIECLFICFKLF